MNPPPPPPPLTPPSKIKMSDKALSEVYLKKMVAACSSWGSGSIIVLAVMSLAQADCGRWRWRWRGCVKACGQRFLTGLIFPRLVNSSSVWMELQVTMDWREVTMATASLSPLRLSGLCCLHSRAQNESMKPTLHWPVSSPRETMFVYSMVKLHQNPDMRMQLKLLLFLFLYW